MPYVSFATPYKAAAFFLEMPDMDASETFVSVDLRIDVQTITELVGIFTLISKTVGLSANGCFNIHQLNYAWHGFGVEGFLKAIEDWEQRYAAANLLSPHHSEHISYVDVSEGILIALTSRQRVGSPAFLFSSELEIQLAEVPVDLSRFQELCRKTGNLDAQFKTRLGSGLHRAHFVAGQVELELMQKIVTVDRDTE
jgi:hypothetical protein